LIFIYIEEDIYIYIYNVIDNNHSYWHKKYIISFPPTSNTNVEKLICADLLHCARAHAIPMLLQNRRQ